MIKLNDLTHTFPKGGGIHNIDFTVSPGEVVGFIGPNGAGKTTTIRHLLGFIQPTSGTATIGGQNAWTAREQIMPRVGFISGEVHLPTNINAATLFQTLLAVRGHKSTERLHTLIDQFQLDTHKPIGKMSKGNKQKVAIIAAFMHAPDYLILDEPTSGLDPVMQQTFHTLIRTERERGATILMSSHQLDEMQNVCDRAVVIREGRIVADGSMSGLLGVGGVELTVAFAGPIPELPSFLSVSKRTDTSVTLALHAPYADVFQWLSTQSITKVTTEATDAYAQFLHLYGKEQQK
ncbi:MAG: ABC transporter ATP-binding protein [Bacilli bacterium]